VCGDVSTEEEQRRLDGGWRGKGGDLFLLHTLRSFEIPKSYVTFISYLILLRFPFSGFMFHDE
jgi:hypothetical protein